MAIQMRKVDGCAGMSMSEGPMKNLFDVLLACGMGELSWQELAFS
jgi:hypothetical protein